MDLGMQALNLRVPKDMGCLSCAHSILGLGFSGSREQPELAILLQGPHGIRPTL